MRPAMKARLNALAASLLLTAAGAIARGAQVEAAGNGRVQTATTGTVIGTALTAAADGAAVEILA